MASNLNVKPTGTERPGGICWKRKLRTHCKDTIPKFLNKYPLRRKCAATIPIPIFMFLWAILCIPLIDLPILRQDITVGWPKVRIFRSLTDTWMWKLGQRPAIPFLGIHKSKFLSSALALMLRLTSMPVLSTTLCRMSRLSSSTRTIGMANSSPSLEGVLRVSSMFWRNERSGANGQLYFSRRISWLSSLTRNQGLWMGQLFS